MSLAWTVAFIIGVGGEKLAKIRAETGCIIHIGPENWKMGENLYITMKPRNRARNHRGVFRAREMIVESLLEFLEGSDAKGKLLYQLAASSGGSCRNQRSYSGVVHQRSHLSEKFAWMKLLDLPYDDVNGEIVSDDVFVLDQEVRYRVQTTTDCSVGIFNHYDAHLKRWMPHALVWGEICEQVENAASIVTDAISCQGKHQNQKQGAATRTEKSGLAYVVASTSDTVASHSTELQVSNNLSSPRAKPSINEATQMPVNVHANKWNEQDKVSFIYDIPLLYDSSPSTLAINTVDSGVESDLHCQDILRKRSSMSDNISVSANSNSCESSERPRKIPKRESIGKQSNQQFEDDDVSHCSLTIPAWLTDSKKNFFRK